LYIDGTLVGNGTAPSGIAAHTGDGSIANTNTAKDFHDTSGSGFTFQGTITEFQAHNSIRSADWWTVASRSAHGTLFSANTDFGGEMILNATNELYEYTRSFSSPGTYSYSVVCDSDEYAARTSTGNVTVLSASANTLSVFDDQDIVNASVYAGHPVSTYANWTLVNGTSVSSGTCSATFNGASTPLTYDAGSGLWVGEPRYWLEGTAVYNVTCFDVSTGISSALGNVSVQSAVNLTAWRTSSVVNENEYQFILAVRNEQNYTEFAVNLTAVWDAELALVFSATPNASALVTREYGPANATSWQFANLSAGETRTILVNATKPAGTYEIEPVFGVSTPTVSSAVFS
jgi:hypothetical protein